MIEPGLERLAAEVAAGPGLRLRQGAVVAVSSYGLTVTIGGSTEQVTGVKYLGSYAPRVGAHVWLVTDGSDIFAIGHIAPRGVPALRVTGPAQAVANATLQALSFNAEVGTDPWGMWAASPNNTRITVPYAGWWAFTTNVAFVANATGVRGCMLRLNGSSTIGMARYDASATGTANLSVFSGPVSLAANDYVEVAVDQTSGAPLDATPSFGVHYIGPAE